MQVLLAQAAWPCLCADAPLATAKMCCASFCLPSPSLGTPPKEASLQRLMNDSLINKRSPPFEITIQLFFSPNFNNIVFQFLSNLYH